MSGDESHPIPKGRRIALQDAADWRPLKGAARAIAMQFGMEREAAGTLLYEGMKGGQIGHRDASPGAQSHIVTPRGVELAQEAGINYDRHINFQDGTLEPPWGRSYPLDVFWPDVERLARKPQAVTIEGEAFEIAASKPKRGPRDDRLRKVEFDMREALQKGRFTPNQLVELKRKELPQHFPAGGETTCWKARESVLASHRQTVPKHHPNSDK